MPRSNISQLGQRVDDPSADLVGVAHAVDLDQQAPAAVDLEQRGGLVGVDLLAVPDDLFGVVGAAAGLGALEQALDELFGIDDELDHAVELGAELDSRMPSRVVTWSTVRG